MRVALLLQLVERNPVVAQQEGVEFPLGAPRQEPARRDPARLQPVGEVGRDLEIRPRHAARRRHGTGVADARPRHVERDLLLLEPGGLGQHDVGERRRRRHGMADRAEEIERAQRLDGLPRIGVGDGDVDPAEVHRADGIGLAGQHRLDGGRVVAGGLPALRPGPEREPLAPDGLRLGLRRQAEGGIVQQLDIVAETPRPLDPEIAARPVEIAADRHEGVEGAEGLDAGGEGVDPVAADERGGAVGIHPRGLHDVVGRDAGEPGRLGGGVACRAFLQRVEAVAPAGDEIGVVERFGDRDVHHAERDGGVGAGARAEPEIGVLRRGRARRVDDDGPGAVRPGALERLPLHGVGGGRVASHDQRASRVVDVLAADRRESGQLVAQRPAAAAKILIHQPVGRAQRAHQQRHHRAPAEEGRRHCADQRERAVLGAHLQKPVGDRVQRRVPADLLPPAGAALTAPAHRPHQPVRMVGQLPHAADALDAERALRARVVGVGADLGDRAVLQRHQRAAARAALPAGGRNGHGRAFPVARSGTG